MAAMLRRLPTLAGLAVLAAVCAEVAEEMLTGLHYDTAPAPEPAVR